MASLSPLMSLPLEIIQEILRNMDIRTLLACSLLCSDMWRTIYDSVELTYKIELAQDGLIHNMSHQNEMSHAECLATLRARRKAWRLMDWRKPSVINIDGPCHAYEFVGGVFVKYGRGRDFVASWLPSGNQHGHQVRRDDLMIRSRDFAMDPGQDLIILLEEVPVSPQGVREIKLHIHSLNTLDIHPKAVSSTLGFTIQPAGTHGTYLRTILIQVAEDIVAVWIPAGSQRLLLWNWKEGILISDSADEGHRLPQKACDFSFISSRAYIITANDFHGSVHIYAFHSRPATPPYPPVILQLPEVKSNVTVRGLSIHTGPFETPSAHERFATSSEARIHVLSIQYFDLDALALLHDLVFIHNRIFLSYLTKSTSVVRWSQWGPDATRWLANTDHHSWLRYVHGERVVSPLSIGLSATKSIDIYDFNVYSRHAYPPEEPRLNTQPSTITRDGVFKRPVTTNLPYYMTSRKVQERYSGYMIDAEHIIGLKARDDELLELHVFTF